MKQMRIFKITDCQGFLKLDFTGETFNKIGIQSVERHIE